MNDALEALYSTYPPCVRSGYCCKQAPCPFGWTRPDSNQCAHLVGDKPGFYSCAIYDEIKDKPGAELCPAFGAGCPSTLNTDREVAARNQEEAAHGTR